MSRAAAEMTQTAADDAGLATPGVAQAAGGKSARSLCGLVAALFPLRVVLFLALFAWILQAWVDMRLVFQWRESLFLLNFRYLGKFLARKLLGETAGTGWPWSTAWR